MKLAPAAMFALALGLASVASAQMRVAVANPTVIFSKIAETKDLQVKLDQMRTQMQGELQKAQEEIKGLQAKRDDLQQDSQQYRDANSDLLKKAVELKANGELRQIEFDREQKMRMTALFDKITNMIASVAKEDKYDLVLTETRIELPPDLTAITIEQLRGVLSSRNILYVTPEHNLTEKVIAKLNAAYAGAK